MTLVEFFDGEPIYDTAAMLALSPDKILFVGENRAVERRRSAYERFIAMTKPQTVMECCPVNSRDPLAIAEKLERILERENDCVFDLTGGQEMALIAVGMVYERHRKDGNMRLCRVNLTSGSTKNAIDNTPFDNSQKPQLTVAQAVSLYGGIIGGSTDGDAVTDWDFTPEFCEAIRKLWRVNAADPSAFNKRVVRLCEFEKYRQRGTGDALRVIVRRETAPLRDWDEKMAQVRTLLDMLQRQQLVRVRCCDEQMLDFSYCSAQVKRCLSKAGNLLELLVLAVARWMTDKHGNDMFNDSLCGVHIDWDGHFGGEQDAKWDTLNEIDVFLMRGMIPVFVSCKNGTVGDDELYKLSVVADRFGGPLAKKVLIGTYIDRNPMVRAHLEQRAKAMGITLIGDIHRLDGDQLTQTLHRALGT